MGLGLGLDMGNFGGQAIDPLNETFKMSATGHVDIEGIRVGGAGIQKPASAATTTTAAASASRDGSVTSADTSASKRSEVLQGRSLRV